MALRNNYQRKLNGYRCSHRYRWKLLQNQVISEQALLLFEFYLDVFDFDYNHLDYGLFEYDVAQLCKIFNKSPNTIRNWHKELEDKGFIGKLDKKVFNIPNPERYIAPGRWKGKASSYSQHETNKHIVTILKSIGVNNKLIEEISQPIEQIDYSYQSNQPSIAINSSKVHSKVNKHNEVLSDEELDEIDKHLDF